MILGGGEHAHFIYPAARGQRFCQSSTHSIGKTISSTGCQKVIRDERSTISDQTRRKGSVELPQVFEISKPIGCSLGSALLSWCHFGTGGYTTYEGV